MKKKYIFIIIGIVLFMLVALLVLVLTKIINITIFVTTLVVVFISSLLIWWVVLLKSKKIEKGKVEEDIVEIDEGFINKKISESLFELDILEYEKELLRKGVKRFGYDNTPIYEKKFIGLFENKVVSVLVNTKTKEINIEFYDQTKLSDEEIEQKILLRGNLSSMSPIKRSPKETTLRSELTGVEKVVKEEVELEKGENKKDEGGLE